MKIRKLVSGIRLDIRKGGVRWCVRNNLKKANLEVIKFIDQLISYFIKPDKDTLFAFYDLDVNPVTYDFLYFMVGAELQRKSLGLKNLRITIVPGKKNGLRDERVDYEQVIDFDKRVWRLHNIVAHSYLTLIPNSDLQLPNSRDLVHHEIRKSKYVYPPNYSIVEPTCIDANLYTSINNSLRKNGLQSFFTSGISGRQYIKDWLKSVKCSKRLVVITLRNYRYGSERNSNIDAWIEFARSLDPNKYKAVFIPDTDSAYDDSMMDLANEFLVMREASFSLPIRLALYEYAYVNMSVSNGPSALFTMNTHCRYLFFKILTPSVPQTTEEVWRSYGYIPGKTPEYATNLQKWVWEEDDSEILIREFSEFVKRAEESNVPDVPILPK